MCTVLCVLGRAGGSGRPWWRYNTSHHSTMWQRHGILLPHTRYTYVLYTVLIPSHSRISISKYLFSTMVFIFLWVFKNILTTYLRCLLFILSYLIELSKVSNRIERLSYVSIIWPDEWQVRAVISRLYGSSRICTEGIVRS